MTSQNLENLVKTGSLKSEPASQGEFNGLLRSAKARLTDAGNASLAIESRFDLAYNASHALALAALRWHGYRSDNRYIVFQCLQHTLDVKPEVWRVLAQVHLPHHQHASGNRKQGLRKSSSVRKPSPNPVFARVFCFPIVFSSPRSIIKVR